MVNRRKISEEVDYDDVHDDEDVDLGATAVVIPPDGGYGWMIVIACFLSNLIVDGIIFTAGQGFQPKWIEAFDSSDGAAAWVVSLLSGCYLLVGPIASAFVNIFDCRRVCIGGTLLAFTGFLLSYIAPSIAFLYFTFGVMGGVGLGFVFLPSMIIVSCYFEQRRATATGIALCGSGIGTFIFAPFIKYLLHTYVSWQSCLLIISGITLNCLICGSLYRPLKPTKRQLERVEEKMKAIDDEQESEMIPTKAVVINGATSNNVHRTEEITQEIAPKDSRLIPANVAFERFSTGHSRDSPEVQQTNNRTNIRKRTISDRSFRSLLEPSTGSPKTARINNKALLGVSNVDRGKGGSSLDIYTRVSRDGLNVLNRPLSRQDIFYPGSVKNLPEYKAQPDVQHYIASTLSIHSLVVAEAVGIERPEEPIVATGIKETVKATLRAMLDVSLLKNSSFLILAFSGFFTFTGFFVPFIYLPRQAQAVGHSEESSTFLVSLLGITNIVARPLCGRLSDRPEVSSLMLNNVALILAGLATIFVPHLESYWMFCVYCVFFGFGTACFATLRSVIFVELFSLEKLTNAFGLSLLFMGIASLIGSPIAGMLYDRTGSFKISFYVMGTLIALSGVMGIPVYLKSCLKRRKERKYAQYYTTEGSQAPDVLVTGEDTELTVSTARVQIPEPVVEEAEETENFVS